MPAQELPPSDQSGPVLDRAAVFNVLVSGSIDEGEQLLKNALELKPRATPVELPLGHQLGYAACRAMEKKDWLRAVALAGRAFTALDAYLALPGLDGVQRARALAIKAYITDVVLLDPETALAVALEALRSDSANATAQAIVNRLPGGLLPNVTSPSSASDATVEKARAPSLSVSFRQGSGRALTIRGVVGSTCSLETSVDLQSWAILWQGQLEAADLTLDLSEATEQYRFYRIRMVEGAKGD
jgi:hypothetical protein